GVTNDEAVRRLAAYHALAASGIERRHQHAVSRILDLDPGLAFSAHHQAVGTRGHHFGLFLVLVLVLRHGFGFFRRHDGGRRHRDDGDRLALLGGRGRGSDRWRRCNGNLRRRRRGARLGFSFLLSFPLPFLR